jgi:hypothetical protein
MNRITTIASALLIALLAFSGTAAAQGKKEGKGKGKAASGALGNPGGGKIKGPKGRGGGGGDRAFDRGRDKAAAKFERKAAKFEQKVAKQELRGRAGGIRVRDRDRFEAEAPRLTTRETVASAAFGDVREIRPQIRTRVQSFSGRAYDEILQGYSRDPRPREYWTERYDRIVLVNGGYYYFDNGYWYPAYGYDPSYSRYVYDVPVYAYNGLPPDRVLRRVQRELQILGYYRSSVDGLFGPMTRNALRYFQSDYGLPVTGAVDEATLYALGLL